MEYGIILDTASHVHHSQLLMISKRFVHVCGITLHGIQLITHVHVMPIVTLKTIIVTNVRAAQFQMPSLMVVNARICIFGIRHQINVYVMKVITTIKVNVFSVLRVLF